jgi:hypothetical protein
MSALGQKLTWLELAATSAKCQDRKSGQVRTGFRRIYRSPIIQPFAVHTYQYVTEVFAPWQ